MDERALFGSVADRVRFCQRLRQLYTQLPNGELRRRMEVFLRNDLETSTQSMIQVLQQR